MRQNFVWSAVRALKTDDGGGESSGGQGRQAGQVGFGNVLGEKRQSAFARTHHACFLVHVFKLTFSRLNA